MYVEVAVQLQGLFEQKCYKNKDYSILWKKNV